MDRLAFNAMSTINEERLIRQQLTNDLANVSTVGFKRTFEANIQPELAVGFGFDTYATAFGHDRPRQLRARPFDGYRP